jgi:hypothetical protein
MWKSLTWGRRCQAWELVSYWIDCTRPESEPSWQKVLYHRTAEAQSNSQCTLLSETSNTCQDPTSDTSVLKAFVFTLRRHLLLMSMVTIANWLRKKEWITKTESWPNKGVDDVENQLTLKQIRQYATNLMFLPKSRVFHTLGMSRRQGWTRPLPRIESWERQVNNTTENHTQTRGWDHNGRSQSVWKWPRGWHDTSSINVWPVHIAFKPKHDISGRCELDWQIPG